MIDVSRLHMGQSCPRCSGRRVYAVSIPTDEWRCVPSAMPVPWLREHVRDHAATLPCDDPAEAAAFEAALRRFQPQDSR